MGYCSSSTFIIIFIHVNILVSPFLTYHAQGGFDSVIKLPHSGSTRTRTRSKRILSVSDFGAKGDGFHNDTKAFLEVWKIACSLSGFVNVVFPYGKTFLVHPIDIAGPCRSKITLRISGTIVAPRDPEAWQGLNRRKWLYFHGVNHLAVDGGGTIDGMGQEWWARSCKINSTNPCHPAPTALTFHKCKNLKVRNLMLLNSQKMHMAFTSCMRVVASHLEVLAPAYSPNTDGIHISATRSVEVSDSVIRTGDDCISIVRNSSRVWIRNIYCGPGHGISIGSLGKSKAWEKIQNVNVNGAYLFNTDNGVRIKTWQGGKGFASKITFQNILMENVSHPIIIDQYYCDSPHPCKNQTSAVQVGNISFIDIQGSSATEEAIKFACNDASPCEGLYLENIFLPSYFGGNTRSYCWQAHGSAQGFVVLGSKNKQGIQHGSSVARAVPILLFATCSETQTPSTSRSETQTRSASSDSGRYIPVLKANYMRFSSAKAAMTATPSSELRGLLAWNKRLNIVKAGDPILHEPTFKVDPSEMKSERVQKIIDDT